MHVDNLFGQHAATDNGKCYFNAFNAVFKNPDITPWNAFPFWTFNNLKINKHWGEKSTLAEENKFFKLPQQSIFSNETICVPWQDMCWIAFFNFISGFILFSFICSHSGASSFSYLFTLSRSLFYCLLYVVSPPFSILCWFRVHDFLGSPFFITFKCFLQVLSGHTAPISMHKHWCDAV